MKLLRLFAFGVAIGVLASLGSAKLAQAGNAVERNSAPRHARPHSAVRALTASRLAQSNRNPARRPVPRHPSRSPVRTASTRVKPRFRSPGSAATPVRGQEDPTPLFAWRIGHSRSIAHSSLDGLVNSGRGPPRAGPQQFAFWACPPARRCVPCPAPDSPAVLQTSGFASASNSVGFASISVSQHNLLAESYLPITQRSHPTFHRGLMVPPLAVRHEGTAACMSSPSLGDVS
jgi:hypothetical protein